MIQVLFVCLGNICRSPLAQGIFEKIIVEKGWLGLVNADSAGVSAYHQGERPHGLSIEIARQYQIDISGQKSRPVSVHDGREFHYLVAMDRSNQKALLSEFAIDQSKVILLRDFESDQSASRDVPDPYGYGPDAFHEVYAILESNLQRFAVYLKNNHPHLP